MRIFVYTMLTFSIYRVTPGTISSQMCIRGALPFGIGLPGTERLTLGLLHVSPLCAHDPKANPALPPRECLQPMAKLLIWKKLSKKAGNEERRRSMKGRCSKIHPRFGVAGNPDLPVLRSLGAQRLHNINTRSASRGQH